MHALLARQLRRHLRQDPARVEPALAAFVAAVDAAYLEADVDRKLLEHSLHITEVEMQERYRALQRDAEELRRAQTARDRFFQMSTDLLCICLPDGTIRLANQSWTRVLGYPPDALVGTNLSQLVHPEDQVPANARVPIEAELRLKTASGTFRNIVWSSTFDPVGGVVFASARDITELKLRATQATQAQKLQAVGQLAAGVAHEINTPIQYLGDNTEFLRQCFAEVKPLLERLVAVPGSSIAEGVDLDWILAEVPRALSETLEGIARVTELAKALKHFAHPDAKEKTPVDLNETIACALTVARNELKDVADVTLALGAVPRVLGHGGSLNQLFLNLLVNAAHAIADAGRPDRGTIAITSEASGSEVLVSVRDSGIGISEKIRERIFEPYFTTKVIGRGSGQGLALVRSIVSDHQGRIGFDSTPGVGTTFWVRLPMAEVTR